MKCKQTLEILFFLFDVCGVCLLFCFRVEARGILPFVSFFLGYAQKGIAMSNSKKAVVNVSLANAKNGVNNAIKAAEAARKAVGAAEAAILAVLAALLKGSPGTERALEALGHVSAQQKVRYLRTFCKFEKNPEAHNKRLRELAFLTAFGQLEKMNPREEAAMIAAMTRGQGRKALERFRVEGLRPLNNAVEEFYRTEEELEAAERQLARAKAKESDEYRKIGVRR
ncbi:MAG TPA: hypothetical protein PKA63_14635 [Oligoflexia bacterium]|nr:hypothetical protein [Oligoflexia bacterium]HMP49902.1 hypothetical protein [Oligoflexia bacterium]